MLLKKGKEKKGGDEDQPSKPSVATEGNKKNLRFREGNRAAKRIKKAPKQNKAKKPSYRKGTRFVLFIGDEGTILLYIKNNQVLSRQFVPDANEQNLSELRANLEKETKAPLCIVVDSLDQTYVQQTLPPVSSISVQKLMKRRLDRDFGANDIKGAILLGREGSGRKDWNFLMVSIEKSKHISMWLEFVYSLPNRFTGIYVVSVETEILLKNIDRAMGVPKAGTGARWKFFVSHNKVGGFRQVILRDGRLIFTRMAQPVGESSPEVIAGNIEQEMQSTIEYLKRLSFDPQSGMDIYIIAGAAIQPVIDRSKFRYNNFTIMTPYEAAGYLGIEGATQPTDQFGDVILAASIAASTKHVLQLKTPESRKVDNLYAIFGFQRVAAAAMMLGILGYAGSIGLEIYNLYEQSDELSLKQRRQQQNLDSLRNEIKKNNIDVEKTSDVIELYQMLKKLRQSPLEFITQIHPLLGPPTQIKSMEWAIDEKSLTAPTGNKPKITVTMTVEFPHIQTLEAWRPFSKELLASLKAVFKNYDIKITKVPSKYSETEKLDMTFDAPQKTLDTVTNSEVQFTIKEQ